MGHPLFPDEPKKGIAYEGVERIRVGRWAEGTCFYCRRMFGADELRSTDDLFALFGGGYYELAAFNANDDEIKGRIKITLRGKRLPLNAEDDDEPNPNDEKKMAKNANGEPSIVQLIVSMQQNAVQQQQMMMTFFTTLIQSSKEESRALIESSKHDARAMADMAAKASETQLRVMGDFFARSIEMAKATAPSPSSSEGTFSPEQLLELGSALADARNDGLSETVGKLTDTFRFAVEARQKQREENADTRAAARTAPPAAAPTPDAPSRANGHGPVA